MCAPSYRKHYRNFSLWFNLPQWWVNHLQYAFKWIFAKYELLALIKEPYLANEVCYKLFYISYKNERWLSALNQMFIEAAFNLYIHLIDGSHTLWFVYGMITSSFLLRPVSIFIQIFGWSVFVYFLISFSTLCQIIFCI